MKTGRSSRRVKINPAARVPRRLYRIVGPRAGAVMIEYVMLALLGAAAVAGAVYTLSDNVREGVNTVVARIFDGDFDKKNDTKEVHKTVPPGG